MNILQKISQDLHPAAFCRRVSALIIAGLLSLSASAQSYPRLITNISQISGLGTNLDERIIDPSNVDALQPTFTMGTKFEVTLNTAVTLTDNDGLIMYLGRYDTDGAPTLLQIEGKNDNNDYATLGYVHIQFRGGINTHEFSDPIYTETPTTVNKLRVSVLKVNRPSNDGADTYRIFKLNFFTYKKGDIYPDGRLDPLRYGTDYYKSFRDYSYESNGGILDERNHYGSNLNYPTETPWGANNTFVYDGEVHELPTFNKQGGGQMPHVTETTLYAMPGDIISLSPYYDLPTSGNYREKYSHWYGYYPRNSKDELQEQDYHHVKDSEGNRLLDFLVDPAGIVYTDNVGYFAGTAFPRSIGTYVINNFDDLKKFSDLVVQGNGYQYLDAILAQDIDCEGARMQPIGRYNGDLGATIGFAGTFNGNGHTISNLNVIQNPWDYNIGFFGELGDGAIITNLNLVDVNVISGGRAGVLAGSANGLIDISNCLVKGNVEITSVNGNDGDTNNISYAGGILGIATQGAQIRMSDVAFLGQVSGGYGTEGSNGALIGYLESGTTATVSNCYADAQVGNIHGQNGMLNNFDPVIVSNSYMNVTSLGNIPGTGINYLVHQPGFANVFPDDPNAFHTIPEAYDKAPGSHYVRVYGIPDDPELWPVVYINCWGGGMDTGWPGIQLTKGDGYYYTTIPDRGVARMMVNNGNDTKPHDYVMGNQAGFSIGGDPAVQVDFGATGGDYKIIYNGHQQSLTVEDLTGAASASKIKVLDNQSKWDSYVLYLVNNQGQVYSKVGPDAVESSDGQSYAVFNIPADFNHEGLRYTVLPYKGNVADSPLLKTLPNPLPAQGKGTKRVYVKKFTADGWNDCRAYVWSEGNLGADWPGASSVGIVNFDGDDYYCFDVPSVLGKYGGLNFTNGVGGGANNGERLFQDAIVYYDGDMKVELTQVNTDGTTNEGKISGGYFNPIFFEFQEGQTPPQITVNNQIYTAGTVTVDGKTYYYINFAPRHDNCDRLVVGQNHVEERVNPTVIDRSEILSEAEIWASQGFDSHVQFYTTLPLDGDPTVYLNTNDFYTEVRNSLGWTDRYGVPAPLQATTDNVGETVIDEAKFMSHADLRWYGTEATFYQPYKSGFAPNSKENLELEKKEYHIAADFGHEFNPVSDSYNLDCTTRTIHEPIINFRHIFHIKDGKTFADANTTSKDANEKYVKNNSRAVSARSGADFQIRLTQQVPAFLNGATYNYSKTNFYYKKGDGVYERVPRVGIEVTGPDDTRMDDMFFFDATVETQGTRKYPAGNNGFAVRGDDNGAFYYAGNGGTVYRSLFCRGDRAVVGTYTVRLKAQENDGSDIKILGTNDNLYLDEYVITFLEPENASLLTVAELAEEKNYTHTTAYLEQEEVCGPPAVVVDFDQYRTFEETPYNPADFFRHHGQGASDQRSYKWPVLWQKSTYSFGYGGYYQYDFNEYIIANHSNEVMYHAAADTHSNTDTSRGLYDRLYYDTYAIDPANAQKGYFLYTNAASDPGVAARLQINNLCPGSTVAVSAWIAEMSFENEVANLCFNFVAVDGDGNREIVHSYVSGYVDRINYGSNTARHENNKGVNGPNASNTHHQGEWMHIYYSFIPDLSSVQNLTAIDHYELELENNCVSSIGADYAVDDIRAYIISPAITARQLNPVCDANQTKVGIRLRSRFDKLLSSNGLEEAANEETSEKITLNFAVLDKTKYDALYKEYQNKVFGDDASRVTALNEVVRKSAIQVVDTDHPDQDKAYYTPMEISSYYQGMPEYDEKSLNEAMRYTSASNAKYFQANLQPTDTDLRPGKDYYIVLYAQYGDLPSPETEGLGIFAVTDDPCAKYAVMTLQGSGIIKIDGIAYTDGEPIDVCVGQSPVVQVDLKMISDGKEVNLFSYDDYVNAPNHYYDWFNGPVEEFMVAKDGNASSYYDLLYLFRNGESPNGQTSPSGNGHLDASELPEPVDGEEDIYAPLRNLIADGKLVLHASSFVFPPLEDKKDGENIYVLTAMPIIPGPDDEDGYKVCSQPNEIRLHVQDNSPLMFDGFPGIEYPNADVPVRAGFRQLGSLKNLDALTSANVSASRLDINTSVTVGENMRKLELPLRGLRSYKGQDVAAEMTMAGNRNQAADPYVYLVETNDPSYIGLDKHPMDEVAVKNSLLPIGMVAGMSAKTGADGNNVTIVFDKNMQFSEGYFYRVRFAYDELIATEVEGYCEGHVVFTIKVVPEYLKWTGAESRNWNNDANWSRVTKDEILLPDNDGKINDFTLSGLQKQRKALVENSNGVVQVRTKEVPANQLAYVPMDFTKTLVTRLTADDETDGYPYMFGVTSQEISTLHGQKVWNNQAAPANGAEGIDMEASNEIEFDMAAYSIENGPLAVRPWYANTCEQIHFNHGAEMVHQEHFIFGTNYQKAWVDMEMTGDRWYTLGSPLQGVVAGDMYTKTSGGKQDNELFTDITFNNTDYGRYAPAVYQRGWNKAQAKTYLLGDNSHDSKSAAVSLNWSRVYNDVDEDYLPGQGFSIRTVTEKITNPDKAENNDVTVRFRLPKADDSYSYFDQSGNTENADNTTVNRNGASRHALTAFTNGEFTTTLSVGAEGKYFLAGNPFMAGMRMAEFLSVNSDVIENAYWIMTSDRQDATYWDEKSNTFISTAETDGVIAPMQGFFVKAKNASRDITLRFTPGMIDDSNRTQQTPVRTVRSQASQMITVSALDADDKLVSRAVINITPEATVDFDSAEDVSLLVDNTLENNVTVYTVASEQALAINSVNAVANTEVGVMADENNATSIVFEGIDDYDGLKLLDTATGEIKDLYDGLRVDVKGSAFGRFYITRGDSSVAEVTMDVVLKNHTVSIVAEEGGITARVYTPAGVYVGEWSTDDTVLHFDLEPGIYIVEALGGNKHMTRKFIVK